MVVFMLKCPIFILLAHCGWRICFCLNEYQMLNINEIEIKWKKYFESKKSTEDCNMCNGKMK